MELTRILHLCGFVKVDSHAIPTVKGLVGDILLSLDDTGKRYMDVAPLCSTPESLSLFSNLCGGGC